MVLDVTLNVQTNPIPASSCALVLFDKDCLSAYATTAVEILQTSDLSRTLWVERHAQREALNLVK